MELLNLLMGNIRKFLVFLISICTKKLNNQSMLCFLVSIIFLSPLALKITVLTLPNSVTVLCCYVTLKITLCRSLIITLITRVLDTFMFCLNMYLKIILSCGLIITLMTKMLDSFMYRSVMCVHTTICSKHFSTFWTHSRLRIT